MFAGIGGFRSGLSKFGDFFMPIGFCEIDPYARRAYIDTGVKIIIGVVIGGVILAGLYALFNTTIIPTLTTKIGEMFNYAG